MATSSTVKKNYEQVSYGASNGAQVGGHCRTIISDGVATRQLLAQESGALCLFDLAAGVVYTLPDLSVTAPGNDGMYFDFRTVVTVTSNSAKTITAASTQFLLGDVQLGIVAAATTLAAAFNGTTHVAITSNGSTTGGVIGDAYRVTAINATQWLIEGFLSGSGSIATPAATS